MSDLSKAASCVQSARMLDAFGKSLKTTQLLAIQVKARTLVSGRMRVQVSDSTMQTICDSIADAIGKAVSDLTAAAQRELSTNDAQPATATAPQVG